MSQAATFRSSTTACRLQPTSWIDNGVLSALVQSRHSADLTHLPLSPYIDNLIMDGPAGGPDLDALVAGTDRALLLTCLWYIREVDPQTLLLTGLTRDGVYLVEDGEVTGAVNNFRFNESPVDLLGRIVDIGRSVRTLPREWTDYFTRTSMPALRVDGFNMSSVSEASWSDPAAGAAQDQAASSSIRVRVPHPVPPLVIQPSSLSDQLGAAMSRWAHGRPLVNASRNKAAMID